MSATSNHVIDQIRNAFSQRGNQRYGSEQVTQLQHGLQCATLARESNAPAFEVTAALLHDIGHILPDDTHGAEASHGLDDHHEARGYRWLKQYFPDRVSDPVRLHVAAKRYLCTVDDSYANQLSPTSHQSYLDQGGPMSPAEVAAFEAEPYFESAIAVRRWDDTGKVPGLKTLSLDALIDDIRQCLVS